MSKNLKSTAPPGWSLDRRDPAFIQTFMPVWGWLYEHYFRVQTSGWHHVPAYETVMFVGSHNGGLAAPDMFMMMYDWFRRFGVERPVYGLMHPSVWKGSPFFADWGVRVGAVVAHPKMAIAAMRSGASVLVYPGGAKDVFRPYALRHTVYLNENRAFVKLALREKVPIVPVISTGAHETFLVLADLYPVVKQLHEWGMPWLLDIDPVVFPVYLGLPWGVGIGPLPHLPLPVPLKTRVCEPIKFEDYGPEAARDNAYVTACYELVRDRMQRELDALVAEG
ncbi:lysophospholipid acyltransferase family protein [Leptolyngbya sp. AN02str]|uniref:lysophospholipid acyltransferase family protein n=1 Tax=Leptolyngbya sp. AN02str TaxID=3423363 RepID=UPI003D315508